jgi:cytochrome P450
MMLAMHPNVQQKAYEEVKQFFESCHDEVTLNDVTNLPYLEIVVKETMRLFPAASMVGRQTTGTVKMGKGTFDNHQSYNDRNPTGKHEIPPDVLVHVNIFSVHRNPKYWGDDAELFVPERFEAERFSKIHPYAYLPFTSEKSN